MPEPRRINRPWLPTNVPHFEAACPTCQGVFEFLASEGTRFKHKEHGECWRLICPCCGHKLAKEVPG